MPPLRPHHKSQCCGHQCDEIYNMSILSIKRGELKANQFIVGNEQENQNVESN